MSKITVYSFAKKSMNDDEFNAGGIIANEKKYLDAIGFDYSTDDEGNVISSGEDLVAFYEAMHVLCTLHKKYSK